MSTRSRSARRPSRTNSSRRSSPPPGTSPWPSGRSIPPTTRVRRRRTSCRARWCSPRRRARSTCATQPVVDVDAGRVVAPPRGPASVDRRPARPPGGARRVRGRGGVRRLGGGVAADRGRVGVRRARRCRRSRLRLGRRGGARRAVSRQLLAGRLPVAQQRGRRLHRHRAGRLVPAERIRAVRHGRQRLGVDRRLVLAAPPRRRGQALLRAHQPAADPTSSRASTPSSRSSASRAR